METKIIVLEMVDSLILSLIDKELFTNKISITINYDSDNLNKNYTGEIKKDYYGRMIPKESHGVIDVNHYTCSSKIINEKVEELYKKIMNTSGINNINQINSNNIELNIKNMNEEFNNIINNNNTGSSSGKRKREKKKLIKKKENNIMEFDLKEGQKGIQNEIKEQIKQFVIEEHNNNNNNDALNNENNI